MEPKVEHIAFELRKAREDRQLSQRELSAKVGMPQAQISKIESGSVNPRLESLMDLARALDLEVMLVPRKFVPAVQAITRGADASPPSSDARRATHELRNLQSRLQPLLTSPEESQRLQRTVRELQNFRLSSSQIDAIKKAANAIKRLKPGAANADVIRKVLGDLRTMRNSVAHALPEETRTVHPAYSLREGGDDA